MKYSITSTTFPVIKSYILLYDLQCFAIELKSSYFVTFLLNAEIHHSYLVYLIFIKSFALALTLSYSFPVHYPLYARRRITLM